MPLIECRNLTKTYRKAGSGGAEVTPLAHLDLDIDQGDFVALMGPSGSGKTTLLNLIAGIDTPSAGSLHVAGADITQLSRAQLAAWRAQNVGYIFQLYNLVPVLTAFENVELPLLLNAKLSRRDRARKVAAALELVDLSDRHDHYPNQLSGGQEQRVAIARAIVADPTLLIGDEPTGDLDKASAKAIMELMTRLNKELGKTLLMVTHDPDTAKYARTTLHLDKGKLIERHAAPAAAAGGPS